MRRTGQIANSICVRAGKVWIIDQDSGILYVLHDIDNPVETTITI